MQPEEVVAVGQYVPIEWLFVVAFALGGALIGSFVWWIQSKFNAIDKEFERNEADHERMYGEQVHIHRRLDWIIQHTPSIPPYPTQTEGDPP